jgi:hypothetical protein
MQVDTDKACRHNHAHGLYCDKLHKTYNCAAQPLASQAIDKGHTPLLPAELQQQW